MLRARTRQLNQSRPRHPPHHAAAAAALVAAFAVAIVGAIVQPTLSDHSAWQLNGLTNHRAAAIAGLALNTVAIVLLFENGVAAAAPSVVRGSIPPPRRRRPRASAPGRRCRDSSRSRCSARLALPCLESPSSEPARRPDGRGHRRRRSGEGIGFPTATGAIVVASSVIRAGEQTLPGHEANPDWEAVPRAGGPASPAWVDSRCA